MALQLRWMAIILSFGDKNPNEIISKKISVNSAKSNVVFAYMYEQWGDVDSSYVTDKYKIQP